ncbi:MAG: hypothetical protein U1E76_04240 [Planctomycetota bacterium]
MSSNSVYVPAAASGTVTCLPTTGSAAMALPDGPCQKSVPRANASRSSTSSALVIT